MQFKEAIDQFSDWRRFKVKGQTVKGYDQTLRQFCLFLRNPQIEDISIHHVMDYLNGMKELGWDQNSFVGKCMALRKFFEFYRLQNYAVLDENLIPIPSKEHKLPRVAKEADYRQLIAAIPVKTTDPRHIRNLAIVNLLWDTGARNGEVLALDVDDLDMERRRAVINTEKSKGRRPFPGVILDTINQRQYMGLVEKREHLKKTMAFKEPDALFLSICAGQHDTTGRRFTIRGVGEMLRRYSNRAKLPYLNAHSFRHHMGHHIIKSGGSSADVMNILGHSSVQKSVLFLVFFLSIFFSLIFGQILAKT